MTKSFSVGECFSVGWARFKKHAWFLVGITLGFYVLMFLFAHLIDNVYGGIEPSRSSLDLLSNILFYWLYFGMTVVVLKIIDDQPYELSDLFVFDKQVIFYLVGALLYGLMVGIGFLLLIVPGVYLAIRYGLFWYAIVDGRKGIVDAFKESARITDGVKWNLLVFAFASIGVIVLGVLCLGVGLLVAVPVVMLATAHLYRVLLAQSTIEPTTENIVPPTPERPEESVTASPVAAEMPVVSSVEDKKEVSPTV